MTRQEDQLHLPYPATYQGVRWLAPGRLDLFLAAVFQTIDLVQTRSANDAESPFAHMFVLNSLRMPMGGGERGLGVVSSTSSAST